MKHWAMIVHDGSNLNSCGFAMVNLAEALGYQFETARFLEGMINDH